MKLIVKGALVAAIGLTGAVSANAATVTLGTDSARSDVTTLPMPTGASAFMAPYSSIMFVAGVTNDAGGPVKPPSGAGPATVDLVARTADGVETVVNTQSIYSFDAGTGVEFSLQFINQNTTYYARLNANPAAGVAAPVASAPFAAPAYLRNYPSAFHSNFSRTVSFSGFYSRVDGLPASAAVRTLIQRRSGSTWKTIKILVPNATNNWSARVPFGRTPAVFRVRTTPVGAAKRYVRVDEYKYCVAATKALAAKACKTVKLGIR